MTDTEKRIQIVQPPSEENPFVVFYKPRGIPSAPLFEGDESAFTELAEIFPEVLDVRGRKKIEGGLLHRIDTETEGLLLCATTQESFASLFNFQKEGLFVKKYSAECDFSADYFKTAEGFPKPEFLLEEQDKDCVKKYTVSSRFRFFGKDSKEVRPVTKNSGKAALEKASEKTYTTKIIIDENLRATCFISEGYRHQVRCHLAWLGFPIKGDKVYNPLSNGGFCFKASGISFPHPVTKKTMEFEV